MTIFQATTKLEPDISLNFDEEKQLYVCQMLSRSGHHQLEGPDINSITYQIEAIVREEYAELVRSISKEKETEITASAGKFSDGGAKSQGVSVDSVVTTSHFLLGADKGLSVLFGSVLTSHFTLGMGGRILSGLSGLFSGKYKKNVKKKLFSASVGGILVVATSRKSLRKKLIFRRNNLIQKIMMSVRMSRQTLEKNIAARKHELSKKIRKKRQRANDLRPSRWSEEFDGRDKSWAERITSLKTRVKDRKSRSVDLWSGM